MELRCGAYYNVFDAYHNVFDTKVGMKKFFGKNNAMQQSKKYLSMCLFTFCWQCEGFIYVALDSSHCGWYCGINAFRGNASCLVMGL